MKNQTWKFRTSDFENEIQDLKQEQVFITIQG